jgi:hypothetical protein
MASWGQILLFVSALGVLLLSAVIIRMLRLHARLDTSVRTKLKDLCVRIVSFEQRLNLLQEHALDYMNSLSGDGMRALYELQQILMAQRNLLAQIDQLIQRQQVEDLREADRLIEFANSRARPAERESNPDYGTRLIDPSKPTEVLQGWESRGEELLQLLGLDISLASENSKNCGLPRRRKRKGTSMSLQEAGILAAIRSQPSTKR